MKKITLLFIGYTLSTFVFGQTFNLYKPDPTNTSWSENDLRGGIYFDVNSETIWTISNNKLKKLDGTNWTDYSNISISPVQYSNGKTMQMDADGNLWIASSGQGLVVFNGTTFTEYNTGNSGIPNDFATCLAINESGKIYIGVSNGFGFTSFNGTTWNNNWPSPGISGSVGDVEIDTTNNIVWIATISNLYKLQGNSLQQYNYTDFPIAFATINCLKLDQNNNLWLGTDEGLWKFDGTSWVTYTTSNSSIPSNYVNDLVITNGNMWLATGAPQALVKFDLTNWQVYTTQNSSIQSTNIRRMTFDNDGNLWLATDIGLIKANTAITGINKVNPVGGVINAYPIPASDKLFIRFDRAEQSTIQITDALGKLVKQTKANQSRTEINVADLENGIYFLKLNNASGSYTEKIIISK